MHTKAIDRLKELIRGCLLKVEITNNNFNFGNLSKEFDSVSKLLEKAPQISKYISFKETFVILMHHVFEYWNFKKPPESYTGKFESLLSTQELSELIDNITTFYLSIPREYEILLPLSHSIDLKLESIKLTESIHLEVVKKGENIPFQSNHFIEANGENQFDTIFLKFKVKGYCIDDLGCSTVKEAFSKYKIFIQQGIEKKFLVKNDHRTNIHGLLIGQSSKHHQVKKTEMICIDSKSKEQLNVNLPLEFCRFNESIDIDWEYFKKQTTLFPAQNFEEKCKLLLQTVIELIETKKTESKNIKAAIEWYVDSLISENQSIAFIQLCIGLEALLDPIEKNITERLADRYSFLISRNIEDRSKWKNTFKKLYRLRSKLVHGQQISLNTNGLELFEWGKKLLKNAINKEITYLFR